MPVMPDAAPLAARLYDFPKLIYHSIACIGALVASASDKIR
jgi:hypothetical protein